MPTEEKPGMQRRTFLKIAGACGLEAGCSPAHAPAKIYAYLTPPQDVVPGLPIFYRSLCRECPAGCSVTARSREGRVVKLEGNPEDPIDGGALCARGQASLQRLYAPDRFRGPMRLNAGGWTQVPWDDALVEVAIAIQSARAAGRARGVRLLTRPEPGSAGTLQRSFIEGIGMAPDARTAFEPLDPAPLRAAGRRLFGREELPAFDLAAARTVVAFGADFLESWISPVELTRGFTAGRGRVGPERTRLVWIGPRRGATGASADVWLPARPGSEAAVALGLLRFVVDPANAVPGLAPEAAALRPLVEAFTEAAVEARSGVPAAELVRLGRELAARRPSAILGPGLSATGGDATLVAMAIQLVNFVLGNVGRTVLYGLDPRLDPPAPAASLRALVADMAAGRVDVLLLHHADPVGALPAGLGFAGAIEKVPLVVSFSDRPDATTRLARLILPDHHPLEAFGDVSPRAGLVQLDQPAMRPLWDTRAASQTLLDLARLLALPGLRFPSSDFYDYFLAQTQPLAAAAAGPGGDVEAARRAALERGGYRTPVVPAAVTLDVKALGPFALAPVPEGGGVPIVPFVTALRGGGGIDSAPWLREVPDPTSAIAWAPWIELSPATAASLGAATGDVLAVEGPGGSVELAAYVAPALQEGCAAVPLGPELLRLLPAAWDAASGAPAWLGARASLRRTGRTVELPRMSTVPEPRQDGIVRWVSAGAPAVARLEAPEGMYPPPEHPLHRWVMAIDLDRCTGCQACVVACYAENNVPVVGPELGAQGRNMAWLRIERYFEPAGDGGAGPRIDFLPMLCQQCGSAPCEPVCPVYATYHSPEGLNAQVYNRCVGTRYCSNNCPYKVRTFNYVDPVFPSPLNLQLNPDVTVRSKGVMEKCTFCVQRIRAAENTARDEHRPVRDGEVVTACAQACPARAIVFGDAKDPRSRVAALREDPRGYAVLGELNTLPAITYLARVRDQG
ncbi:MAG: 4Fe-4S dicluster domain-containing protein [Myxococcales bacterium]